MPLDKFVSGYILAEILNTFEVTRSAVMSSLSKFYIPTK